MLKPGDQSWSPTGVSGTQALEPLPAVSQLAY